jgi:O-antigen/teichoic acid export membrane protein
VIALWRRIQASRSEALRLLVNSLLALLALLVTRFANSLFFILLAWTIGETEAGTFALALSYATLFTQFSLWGLDFLLTREVAADRSAAGPLFGSFLALRTLLGLASYGVLLAWLLIFRPHDPHTLQVIIVCSGTILTESIGRLCQAYFAAFEKIGYLALISTLLGVLKLLIGIVVLWSGGDALLAALVVFGASLLATVVSIALAYLRFVPPRWSGTFSQWRLSLMMVMPFALGSVLNTVEQQADTLLVAYLAPGDAELAVGVLIAATTFFFGLTTLFHGYRTAVLPMMARLYKAGRNEVWAFYEKSLLYLLAITLPAAALISIHAEQLVQLVYRGRFGSAGPVLSVVIWALPAFVGAIPIACLMITVQRQAIATRVQFVALTVNLALNLWLVPLIGPLGAAWGRLASALSMFGLLLGFVQMRIYACALWSDLLRLLAALAALLLVSYTLGELGVLWLPAAALAGCAYLLVLLTLGFVRPDDRAWLWRMLGWRKLPIGGISD